MDDHGASLLYIPLKSKQGTLNPRDGREEEERENEERKNSRKIEKKERVGGEERGSR